MQKETLIKNIDEHIKIMPWYVVEYYQSKMTVPYSFKTMFEYLKEYKRFFEWLIETDYVDAITIADIDIVELEKMPKKVMESYFIFLRTYETNRETGEVEYRTKPISEVTINRTRMSIASLYKYLTEQTEDDEGEPYFYRNVMKKLERSKVPKVSPRAKANNIKEKLLLDVENENFIDFIANEYPSTLSKRASVSYEKNKERDLAIISLLTYTGIRLSEAVNANVGDLNLNTMTINVIRKGGKKDSVDIADIGQCKENLQQYLSIRSGRYKATKNDTALFLHEVGGVPYRLGTDGIQRLVKKYSKAYKVEFTPHKLRHSLATRLYASTKDPLIVKNQLGHEGIELVGTYAHIADNTLKEKLDNLNK